MSTFNSISPEKLFKLIGTSTAPIVIDVRVAEDFSADPRLIPGSIKRQHDEIIHDETTFIGQNVVVVCHHGAKMSQGVAGWLRHHQALAINLEGGFEAWKDAKLPLIPRAKIPFDEKWRTVWVTRARPKIDRIACPWLIRRFIDPNAVFLYVAQTEVLAVADRFAATAFDIEGAFWSHRGEACTFDTMIEEFELSTPSLLHLARIIRAADTDRLPSEPEAAGLLAASLGLSRIFSNDLAQLDASMLLYDAFYRWCRDANDERHAWPHVKVKA